MFANTHTCRDMHTHVLTAQPHQHTHLCPVKPFLPDEIFLETCEDLHLSKGFHLPSHLLQKPLCLYCMFVSLRDKHTVQIKANTQKYEPETISKDIVCLLIKNLLKAKLKLTKKFVLIGYVYKKF